MRDHQFPMTQVKTTVRKARHRPLASLQSALSRFSTSNCSTHRTTLARSPRVWGAAMGSNSGIIFSKAAWAPVIRMISSPMSAHTATRYAMPHQLPRLNGGEAPREAHMTACLIAEVQRANGQPIVVVTGGFHTPASCMHCAKVRRQPSPSPAPRKEHKTKAYLVRYGFHQLDGLNGYAAGLPHPAYYDHLWQRIEANPDENIFQAARRIC